MSTLSQTTGNELISCINAAHTKYESNTVNWQQVVEIGWRLSTRQDMERFEQMCEDGLLGPRNCGIIKDWSAIDRSRNGYLRIKDRLVLCVFLASSYQWVTVMHEIPISSAQSLTSLPYPRTQ
jgi:hypothetical protein